MKYQVLLSLKSNDKVFKTVICCSCDCRLKGYSLIICFRYVDTASGLEGLLAGEIMPGHLRDGIHLENQENIRLRMKPIEIPVVIWRGCVMNTTRFDQSTTATQFPRSY